MGNRSTGAENDQFVSKARPVVILSVYFQLRFLTGFAICSYIFLRGNSLKLSVKRGVSKKYRWNKQLCKQILSRAEDSH